MDEKFIMSYDCIIFNMLITLFNDIFKNVINCIAYYFEKVNKNYPINLLFYLCIAARINKLNKSI